jgi:hypothetical protein
MRKNITTTTILLFITGIIIFVAWRCFLFILHPHQTLEEVLKKMFFTPLSPPNTLTPPGTIVTLKNKDFLLIVCSSEQAFGANFKTKLIESKSPEIEIKKDLNGEFNLDLTLFKEALSEEQYEVVKNINFTLSNIKLLEIPDDAVFEYVNDRKPSCEQAINKRISAGQKISIIKRVLQADAVYNIKYDDNASAEIRAKLTSELAVKLSDNTSIRSESSFSGNGLFWGVIDDQILASVRPGQLPPTGSSERKRLLDLNHPLKVEYEEVAHKVKPIKQPSSMSCWATVYTMMLSWKENKAMEIQEAMHRLGSQWENYFQKDQGLPADKICDFIIDAGLSVESPKNYLPSFYIELLKEFGPIWITTADKDGYNSHARLLIGAYRSDSENINSSQERLVFEFIDPASGTIIRRKFESFLEEYEKEATYILKKRRDLPFRIQIIHWPRFPFEYQATPFPPEDSKRYSCFEL